jgi:hypothetical protein
MQKIVLAILAASLFVGSTVQFASAAERNTRYLHRAHLPASQQFWNSYDCIPSLSEEQQSWLDRQQYWLDREAGHVISAPAGRG